MSFGSLFARLVAVIGGGMIMLRHPDNPRGTPSFGGARPVPAAKPQAIPALKMPTAHGWHDGMTPRPARGLKVNAFATGLRHPRQMLVLPKGDGLAAESLTLAGAVRSAFDYAITTTM